MNLVSPLLNPDCDRSHTSWKTVKAVAAVSAVALSCIYLLADNQTLASNDEGMALHSYIPRFNYELLDTTGLLTHQSSDLSIETTAELAL